MVININKKILILSLIFSILFINVAYSQTCSESNEDDDADPDIFSICEDYCNETYPDSCTGLGHISVKEYYCDAEENCDRTYIECDSGKCCSDGACVPTPGSSSDPDGNDYTVKGTCTDNCGNDETDHCSDGKLREYTLTSNNHCERPISGVDCNSWCINNVPSAASGECSDGTCVCSLEDPEEEFCDDSLDGGKILDVFGICKDRLDPEGDSDACYTTNPSVVRETYCRGTDCRVGAFECGSGECCSGGACITKGSYCNDHDPDRGDYDMVTLATYPWQLNPPAKYEAPGSCIDACGYGGDDYCQAGNRLVEWSCSTSGHCKKTGKSCNDWCGSRAPGCCKTSRRGTGITKAYCFCNCGECEPETCQNPGQEGGDCGTIDDGCEGTIDCDACDPGLNCISKVCSACVPECSGKICGEGGCGDPKECGTCPSDYVCINSGQECCESSCNPGWECGNDGCGGQCGGGCGGGEYCYDHECRESCTNVYKNYGRDDTRDNNDPLNPGWSFAQYNNKARGRCDDDDEKDRCYAGDILREYHASAYRDGYDGISYREVDCNLYESRDPDVDWYCDYEEECPDGDEKYQHFKPSGNCAFCNSRERVCTIKNSRLKYDCSGGFSGYCDSGEIITLVANFENDCEIDENTYLQINARSTDDVCRVNYIEKMSGLTAINPEKSLPCAPEHIENDDGSCTVLINDTDLIFDGHVTSSYGDGYVESDEKTIEWRRLYYQAGFIEWNVSSIPDDAVILDTVLIYHGQNNYGDWDTSIYDILKRRPSASTSRRRADELNEDARNGTRYLTDSNSFPVESPNRILDLGDQANLDLYSQLENDWFAIGLYGEGSRIQYDSIYSEESAIADPAPTLNVTYKRFSGSLSGNWTIPPVSGPCGEVTVHAYSVELWDGEPGIGTLIARASDTNILQTNPVGGSLTFSYPDCFSTELTTMVYVDMWGSNYQDVILDYDITKLSFEGLTERIKVEFSPNPVIVTEGQKNALMNITAGYGSEGKYEITVKGIAGAKLRTATYILTVS